MGSPAHGALAVLPARFASTRLPGKPLLRETGKFLVQHVYEAVRAARRVARAVVATDDPRIADAVRSFGGEAVMTRVDHPNGTSRVAEAARGAPEDRILNIQGDEPGLTPAHVDALAALLDDADMATLACEIDPAERAVPDRVKVVVNGGGWAKDFDRADRPGALLHLGLYGFRRPALDRYVALPPSPRESKLRLEQLRALDGGLRIRVAVVPRPRFGGIDTPDDYARFVRDWRGE